MENSEAATKVCGEAPHGFALDQGDGREVRAAPAPVQLRHSDVGQAKAVSRNTFAS